MAATREPAVMVTLAAALVILGMGPHAVEAQRADSLRSDTLEIFPDSFRLDGIRVVAGRRLTVTGGVGVVEMRLDSLASVPVPTLEQALREMPLVLVRAN